MQLRRRHPPRAVAVAELPVVEPDKKGDDERKFDDEAEHGSGQRRNLRMRATITPWMMSSRAGMRSG